MNSVENTLEQLEQYRRNGRLFHKVLIFLLLCSLAFSFFVPSLLVPMNMEQKILTSGISIG